jgi:hypothetical protein
MTSSGNENKRVELVFPRPKGETSFFLFVILIMVAHPELREIMASLISALGN